MEDQEDAGGSKQYTPALIARERQLMKTLRALEAMLETVQELRTKVNFERTQLITLIEMAKSKSRGDLQTPQEPQQNEKFHDVNSDSPKDPLVLLDKLYNGAFCVSEEEEDDDDEDDDMYNKGDDFGAGDEW